jgi:hypothetical protein
MKSLMWDASFRYLHMDDAYVQYVYAVRVYSITVESGPQSTQSDGPVRFFIFCSISIILLASPVTGRKPQLTAGAD